MLSIQKIGIISRTYRHLNRYSQILAICIKYGFDNIIDKLKIDQYIEFGRNFVSSKPHERVHKLSPAERTRLLLTELGPAFVKLGQILSTRPDLLPLSYIHELEKLQDKVPPFSFSQTRRIVESELKKPISELFETFEKSPRASASIGQVHYARLRTGEAVAVKVQRPSIKKIIEVDLEIMLHIATLMEKNIREFALHKPVKIVEEFASCLEREIDYRVEASNMERMTRQFLDTRHIYIPRVFHDMTSEKLLVTEFIDGIKISDTKALEKSGTNLKLITERGAQFLLRQIFEYGFFHADPHPGNIFVLPDNVLCFIDFGMTGSVDMETKETFCEIIKDVALGDVPGVCNSLLEITDYDEEPDKRLFKRDVDNFIHRHLHGKLKDVSMAKVLQDLLEVTIRHSLRLSPDMFMMLKALSTVDGTARLLYPDFDIIEQTKPFIRRLNVERYSPKRISLDMLKSGSELLFFLRQFPKEMLEITRLLKQKKLNINIEIKGFYDMLETHNQLSNRISFSIIIAAMIMGSALILISHIPPLIYGVSLIGIAGFIAAAVMGIWLIIAIIRKGNL